jgi:hypothetical protein
MEFLIKFLASFFSKFKAKNPAVAAVIMTVLSAAIATVESGQLFGAIPVTGWLQEGIKYVGIFLLAVTGSETWPYLNPAKK